jgi:hypothetical protein
MPEGRDDLSNEGARRRLRLYLGVKCPEMEVFMGPSLSSLAKMNQAPVTVYFFEFD